VSAALQLDPDFADEIVDLFFRYFHVSFPNLFHPPSFKAAVADGSIPRILFFGVAGLAARYSTHESVAHIPAWERGRPYVEETERLLALHNTSITTIQACVLLGIAAATQGEPTTESVFYSIAFRMALILDLPNAETTSSLEKELNIRGTPFQCISWEMYVERLTSVLRSLSMVVATDRGHMELVCTLHPTHHQVAG